MLREVPNLPQIPGESRRRWFFSEYFNLIVWYEMPDAVSGFHLHYDLGRNERVFMWDAGHHPGSNGERLQHCEVDDGDRPGRMKMTPMISRAVPGDPLSVAERFERESGGIGKPLAGLVLEKLRKGTPPGTTASQ